MALYKFFIIIIIIIINNITLKHQKLFDSSEARTAVCTGNFTYNALAIVVHDQ